MAVAALSPARQQVSAKPARLWVSAEAAPGKDGSAALRWWLQCRLVLLDPSLLRVHPLFCCGVTQL